MMPMQIARIRRVGVTGANESLIEIMDIIPPYWLIAITESSPTSSASTTTQPRPPSSESAASRKASTGVAFGWAADITAPMAKTQSAEKPLET